MAPCHEPPAGSQERRVRALYIRRFATPHRELRELAATPRYLAALAADRQRVVVWQTTAPDPLATLHLTPLTRHRLADVCWVSI